MDELINSSSLNEEENINSNLGEEIEHTDTEDNPIPIPEDNPISIPEELHANLNPFQQNIDEPYMNFSKDIEMTFIINPLIFFYDFDKYNYYNIGKKVIAPKYMLNQLSKYDNLDYPIHIEINNKIFTIHDFIDDIDCIFIPTENFYNLNLLENEYTTIKILKNIPTKATFLKIKPCSEKFYELQNIKTYLEIHFKKLYPILEKDEIVRLPYGREVIEIIITDCKPENIVSMNEIEELEIDFEPLVDKENIDEKLDMNQIPSDLCFEVSESKSKKEEKQEPEPEESKVFVPFSGKGRRLCD